MVDYGGKAFRRNLARSNHKACKRRQADTRKLCRRLAQEAVRRIHAGRKPADVIEAMTETCTNAHEHVENECFVLGGKAHRLRRKGYY